MARFSIWPASALLGSLALLCLAACAPTATMSALPTATATTPPPPTVTPTLAPAPTPTNVPAKWLVLDTPHFSIAYPPNWTSQAYPQMDGSVLYSVMPPNPQEPSVDVQVQEKTPKINIQGAYCTMGGGSQRVTLAGVPMSYGLSGEEGGGVKRGWYFANTQATGFALSVDDTQLSNAVQAQDDAIFATFRPDNADPWQC